MELQFSVPLKKGTSSQSRVPSAAPTRAASSGTARGSTHRFALDTRTRHTRRSSTRARTGCSTCRKRHVKCDETKPACTNCLKWRGYCDGYSEASPTSESASTQLIHTKKAPLLLTEPAGNTNRFTTNEQLDYFNEWKDLSIMFLSGGLGQSKLWTDTMPQVTLEEDSLRLGAMAVGALRRALLEQGSPEALTTDNHHYFNALVYYCEALKLQAQAKPTKETLRTALMAALLFICFETQRGNMSASLKHITYGFTLLNELAGGTERAPDLVRIAQAPPSMVKELLDCFRPLELQSRSFLGSYGRVHFPTGNPPAILPASSAADLLKASRVSTQAQMMSRSPSLEPSPYPATPDSTISSVTAMASPQSMDSPSPRSLATTLPIRASPSPSDRSSSSKATSSTGSQGSSRSKAKGPRQPGIMPFDAQSPYYKPKIAKVAKLDEMPMSFTSYDEAHGYWTLIMRQMVQYIPFLTRCTEELGLPYLVEYDQIEAKLLSVEKNPKIGKFISESRYWLQRWIEAFEPLFNARKASAHQDMDGYLGVINLRIEYLLMYIYTAIPRYAGLVTAKGLTVQYRELTTCAEALISAKPGCGFSMDSGWTWPLFVASFGCRDPSVREDAIRILGQHPHRNALTDSRVFRAIALKNKEVEEMCSMYGNENEQWLQLRRRELVFENHGNDIIFRSPVRDERTGFWRLREEVAAFVVQEDGLLRWTERPISDSMSILAGVC